MLTALGYSVVAETEAGRVMGLLRQGDFDVALIDMVMPGIGGLRLTEMIRAEFRVLPIIVVTGYGSVESTVAAMRRGATDFVAKPVDFALLDLRIRQAFDLELARRLANTDGLTGLYNHRHLQERLRQEVDRARRYGRPLSLIMADLDHFKAFNDRLGHPRGDQALIEVAHTLRQVSRSSDVAARYGGEEFILILPETPAVEAMVVAERTRQCVEALRLGTPLTVSLGVAAFRDGQSQEALIEAADAALYESKRRGRNRVCLAETADRPPQDGPQEPVAA